LDRSIGSGWPGAFPPRPWRFPVQTAYRPAGRHPARPLSKSLIVAAQPSLDRLERALVAFLVYGAFEGLLKRLTGYAWYVYPIKDLFFLYVLASWVRLPSRRGACSRSPLSLLLGAYLALIGVEILNPYLPSVLVGLIGVRASYMYAVLYFIAFRAFDTEGRMIRLGRWIGCLAVITALGAMAEALLGLNWVYDNRLQVKIAAYYMGVSGNWTIRPSSIGNGPGSAAMMEFIGATLLLGLAVGERRFRLRTLLLVGAALAFGGIILSAVRIIWLQVTLAAAIFVFLLGRRMVVWGMGVGVLVGVGILLGVYFSSGEITARFQTLRTPLETYRTEPSASQRYTGLLLLPEVVSDYPLGAGVGWNVPRVDALAPLQGDERILHFGIHNYLSVLALEVGAVGLLLFLTFAAGVLFRGLLAVHREEDEARRPLLAACYATFSGITLSFLFGGGIIGWPGEYYWVLAGIIIRLSQMNTGPPRRPGAAEPMATSVGPSLSRAAPRLRR
jgi:hypothetical protein